MVDLRSSRYRLGTELRRARMNTSLHYHLAGLGQSGAQSAVLGLATAASADPEPISKAVLSVATLITSFFAQPNYSKIATTEIVNQAEVLLKNNLAAWQGLPAIQRNSATQAAALQNFDAVWTQVQQACLGGNYGSAGNACIADREQGACHFQANGQCWNWFIGYRDPISNDPAVAANAASPSSSTVSVGTAITAAAAAAAGVPSDSSTLFLLAGAAVLVFMVMSA